MKRLTFCLALLALLIAGTVGAYRIIEVPEVGARTVTMVMGGVAATGVTYTDCSNIGTAAFTWTGEHSSGNTYGCKNSSTAINGTATGAEIVNSSVDPGTESPSSGGYAVKVNSVDERLTFTVTSKDIFDSAEGRWCGDVYASATTGNNVLFRGVVGGSDVVLAQLMGDGRVQVLHTGAGVQAAVISTDTVSDTTWTNCCVRWSVANNKVSVKIGEGSWKDDEDEDAVTAFASEPATVRVAGGATQTDTVYIDNVFLWTTSGI